MEREEKRDFLDSEKNRKKLRTGFYMTLVVLVVADFFVSRHGHFTWESAPAFYAAYGFIACVSLIFVARLLRLMVGRKENHYD